MVDQTCHICGTQFSERHPHWLASVQVLYVKGFGWSEPQLTASGSLYPDRFNGPLRSGFGYVDILPNGQSRLRGYIDITDIFPLYEEEDRRHRWPGLAAKVTPWGFIFHDSCWTLLQEACNPDDIDLRALVAILRSFPPFGTTSSVPISPHRTINWGHDYGGKFKMWRQSHNLAPGALNLLWKPKVPDPQISDSNLSNPVSIPVIQRILKNFVKERKSIDVSVRKSKPVEGNDCFTALGPDLRELLLSYLDSTDMLHLFHASKTMAGTFRSQGFWKSRFQNGREFDMIFEARHMELENPRTHYRDWRGLYRALLLEPLDPVAKDSCTNRRRIWPLVRELAHVLNLLTGLEPQGEPCATFWDKLAGNRIPEDTMKWQPLCPRFSDNRRVFLKEGCQTLSSRRVTLSESRVIGVSVYRLTFHGIEYVTGLEFHQEDGRTVELGFIIKGRGRYLDLNHGIDGRLGKGLYGFHATLGWKGLHALAIATDISGPLVPRLYTDRLKRTRAALWRAKSMTEWTANPEGFHYDAIVSKYGPVRMIKAHFDGMSMVGLDIPWE